VRFSARVFFALAALFPAVQASAQNAPQTGGVVPFISLSPGTGPIGAYVWGGYAGTNHYQGGYTGALWAMNGNLLTPGVVFRADFAAGVYTYRGVPPFQSVRVNTEVGDIMVGYRSALGAGWITGYIGPAVESHHNPDPAAEPVRGTSAGVKIQGDVDLPVAPNLKFYGMALYSQPLDTFYAMAKTSSYISPGISLGPQVSVFTNDKYSEYRVGPALNFENVLGRFDVSLSGGYLHPTSGADGYFAGVFVGMPFRR